jgi:transposase-like protein
MLRSEHEMWRRVKIRCSQYFNNIVEQDHRAIKSRCRAMKCLKSFKTATVAISGIEFAHRMRKRQFVGLTRDRSQPVNLARTGFAAVMT